MDPEKGEFADDIVYASVDGPSEFAHPMCDNTFQNGKKLGDEAKAKGLLTRPLYRSWSYRPVGQLRY